MDEENNKKQKNMFIFGLVALLLTVVGATYAYFAVTTVNNFGTSTINAVAGEIGTVTLNGSNAQLNLSVTALDMVQGNSDIAYYASSSGKTTTPTTVTLGTATVTPSTDTNYYHCTYTLSVTHTGTNDMYTAFSSAANKSTGQIILTINGVDYDFYNGWPTSNQVTGSFYIRGTQTKDITAGLRIINDSEINQNYLANTDISISISLVNNSLSCEPDEEPIAITYINRQTTGQITPEDEIAIGEEHFYVVSSDSTNTILLAKYALKSDENSSYMQDVSGTSAIAVNFLDSNNIAYWDGCEQSFTTYSCSNSPSGLKSKYANSANVAGTTTYTSPFPNVYDNNAVNIYPVVESYANKIASGARISVTGRLMKREEASGLSINIRKSFGSGHYYWLDSASSNRNVDVINYSGNIVGISGGAGYNCEIRPVIVINTSDIDS